MFELLFIFLLIHRQYAGTQTAPDLILETRTGAISEVMVRTGPQEKMLLDDIDSLTRSKGRRVWPEITVSVFDNLARGKDSRPGMGNGDLDAEIALVVFQPDIVARLVLLDQVVLEDQGFFLIGSY